MSLVAPASSDPKAPTVCPTGVDSAFASTESLGKGIAKDACGALGGCLVGTDCRRSPVPSLDDLAGEWQTVEEVYNHPSAEGFWGGIATTSNLLSFTSGTFPPFSQGGESAALQLDGEDVNATSAKWYPYQVVRTAAVGTVNITSTVRVGFEKNLVMLRLEMENTGDSNANPALSINLASDWRFQPGSWPWTTPRPDQGGFPTSFPDNTTALTTDSQSSTSSAFAFSMGTSSTNTSKQPGVAIITPTIPAHGNVTLLMTLAVGNQSSTSTVKIAKDALTNFTSVWDESQSQWSQRYQDVFTPGNGFFSGSLPVLVTDDAEISALWYQSVISILMTMRTNLRFPRVYATVGPDEGTTIVYAWDTSLWSGLLALLDPDFLKEQVSLFLKGGVYSGYAVDYLSEGLVGPWYSANDLAIFTTMLRYVNMTGDYAWLKLPAGQGSTNLAQMEARATYWKTLLNPTFGLADYGKLSNLLEEVVTYVNMVPSLNAANVWMMDEFSSLLQAMKNTTGASTFASMAQNLSATVLSLYAGPGTGYWLTTYPDGTRQAVKHVYDFDTISVYFTKYLNESIKSDMLSFMHHDLYTGPWMRALSLSDLAANVSMRPDHGSNGAYAAWPALAAAGASRLGDYNGMMTYLKAFSGVLAESTWAQCYQLIDPAGPASASAAESTAQWAASVSDFSGSYFGGKNGTAPGGLKNQARISLPDQGETFNENNGASFGDVVLTYVFGWNPDGTNPVLRDPSTPRGTFSGSMVGVRGPGGTYHQIDVGTQGVTVKDMKGPAQTLAIS
ncbi:MAG: hypothetical protein M1838_000242 [Thelocarpon superellum]|nr:MAG: hypothetical protein M1838_000242 [Thelocarpon superellum]